MKRFALILVLAGASCFAGRLFNGSTQCGIVSGLNSVTYPLTLSAWVFPNATNSNWCVTCVQSNAGGATQRYFIGVLGSSGFSGQWTADESDPNTRLLGPAIVTNQWHHVAAVFASSSLRYLYVNGVPVATNTYSYPSAANGKTLNVGQRFTTAGAFGQYALGRLGEIALWDVELTANEIAALASGVDARVVKPTAPLCYYPMLGIGANYTGALALTLSNSPALTTHPSITRP